MLDSLIRKGINRGYEDLVGSLMKLHQQISIFPFGTVDIQGDAHKSSYIPNWVGSGTLTRIWYRSRELLLQVVQHLYSTSLVVQMRDSLLRLQKEQFYSISLVLAYRENRKRLCWIWFYHSRKWSWNHNIQKIINHPLLVLSTISGVGVIASSFDPPEGTYLHIFGKRILRLKVGFAAQSTREVMRLSGELRHPDIDYTPHYGIDRNIGIETGLTIINGVLEENTEILALLLQGSFRNTLLVSAISHSRSFNIQNKRTYHQLMVLSTFLVLVQMVTVLVRLAKTESEILTESNLVRRKDSFQQPSLVLDLSYSTSRQLEQTDQFHGLWILWRRQRSRHIWSNYHSSGRWYLHRREDHQGSTKQMALEHTLTVVLLKTKQQHSPKLVVDLYLQSVEYQSLRLAELVAGTSIFNGEQMLNPSLHRLQKILQHLHYLEKGLAHSRYDFNGSGTLTIRRDINPITGVRLSRKDLVHSLDLVLLQNQQSNHLLQEQFLQISQVLQRQDTSKYSKTSFHLVHSQYLENSHIQISITHQRTLVLEMSPYLVLPRRGRSCQKLDLVLLHSLVHLLSDLQQTIWKEQSSSTQKAPLLSPHSIKFTDTTETTEIQAHLVLQQYLVLVLQNQYRYLDTMETTKIQHIWNIYILQYTSRTSICRLHTFDWYWCCSPLPDRWNCTRIFTFANYETQGRFKGLASVKESFARATYVGIGQVNTFGIGQTEYACYRGR